MYGLPKARFFSVIILLLTISIISFAQQEEDDRDAMTVLRERITGLGANEITVVSRGATEINGDWIVLRRDAEVNIGSDRSILADVLEYNPKQNKVRARGNVVLLENKMRIGGDEIELNLTDNSGYLVNPYIETEEGYIITGSRLNKIGPDEYEIENAAITSCNQPRPNWNMAASNIYLKSGDYASLRHFRLRAADAVPILYLPWMRIPFDRERATGLLIPEWGHSEYHGYWVSNKFFWAINDSHDATAGIDYYQERGVRFNGEYRNDLGNGNSTYIRSEFIDDDTFPKDRFYSVVQNRSKLPANFNLNVNLEFISDETYKRDFFNRNAYFIPFYRKSVFLTNNYEGFSLVAGYSDLDRFRTRNRISQIRYLPSLSLSSRDRQLLDTPIYYNFSLNYDRPSFRDIFRRNEFGKEDQIYEKTYDRWDGIAEVKMPIKRFAPWFTVTPTVRGRFTHYSKQWDDRKREFLEETVTRNYFDIDITATGPVFSKFYGDPQESRFVFKHVITPSVTYLYRSDLDYDGKENQIVLDHRDTIFRSHELKWNVSNVVFMKDNEPDQYGRNRVYELFRFGVTQYVSIEDDLLTSYSRMFVFDPNNLNVISRYSPLIFDAGVRLFDRVSATGTLEYDTNENTVNNFSLGTSLNSSLLNAYVGWFRTVGVVYFTGGGLVRSKANRFIGRGTLNLFEGKIRLNGYIDYDVEREYMLNALAGVDFHTQCFGLKLEFLKLNQFGQDDTQTRFSITLGGLGGILGGGQ
jgi:lipopolysaccharide assembly outer membrane protein LptD (OstA)